MSRIEATNNQRDEYHRLRHNHLKFIKNIFCHSFGQTFATWAKFPTMCHLTWHPVSSCGKEQDYLPKKELKHHVSLLRGG